MTRMTPKALLTAAALVLLAGAASAQTVTEEKTAQGNGATLRGLDKIDATTKDFHLSDGQSVQWGSLKITLDQCRYPVENPMGDAYAFVHISEPAKSDKDLFAGWMIASSPALNALDNFRYDLWVLHCDVPAGTRAEAAENATKQNEEQATPEANTPDPSDSSSIPND